jgi:AcrR family transcriptional regulator
VSPRVELGTRRPRRRTHAERTAESRARIMSAVVESIAEVGFKRSTASEIARRSGLTWGAVQHHFGGKEGILAAVLEDSFNRFAERLADIDSDGAPLAERVELFVDRAWEHFGSAHFRSTFEILQHYGASRREHGWQEQMLVAWNGIWTRLFADAPRSRRRRIALQHYTVSVLAGLASLLRFESPSAVVLETELGLLKETLVRELARKGAER